MTSTRSNTSNTSDLKESIKREDEEGGSKKSSQQILVHELIEGTSALERPLNGLFISGLSAGLDIGFSVLLMTVVISYDGSLSEVAKELLLANMYAVGFIFVILGRSELFTEQTTLAVLPVLGRRANVRSLARLWGVVFTANVIGTVIFAAFVVMIGPALGVIESHAFMEVSIRMTKHSMPVMFGSAVLAGWLMGLLSWLVAAARDTISQILITWLTTAVIGLSGLHHAIVGSVEVLVGVFSEAPIYWSDFGRFLLMAGFGNALGGSVFVALIKYAHAVRGGQK